MHTHSCSEYFSANVLFNLYIYVYSHSLSIFVPIFYSTFTRMTKVQGKVVSVLYQITHSCKLFLSENINKLISFICHFGYLHYK